MYEPDTPTFGADAGQPTSQGDRTVTRGDGQDDVAARAAEFAELSATSAQAKLASLDSLLDVSVTVTAELGRTTTSIGNLLKLGVGSVIELERSIAEPLDLMAQGVRLARGEVVVVDDRFAIRIKEIIEPRKRQNGHT